MSKKIIVNDKNLRIGNIADIQEKWDDIGFFDFWKNRTEFCKLFEPHGEGFHLKPADDKQKDLFKFVYKMLNDNEAVFKQIDEKRFKELGLSGDFSTKLTEWVPRIPIKYLLGLLALHRLLGNNTIEKDAIGCLNVIGLITKTELLPDIIRLTNDNKFPKSQECYPLTAHAIVNDRTDGKPINVSVEGGETIKLETSKCVMGVFSSNAKCWKLMKRCDENDRYCLEIYYDRDKGKTYLSVYNKRDGKQEPLIEDVISFHLGKSGYGYVLQNGTCGVSDKADMYSLFDRLGYVKGKILEISYDELELKYHFLLSEGFK